MKYIVALLKWILDLFTVPPEIPVILPPVEPIPIEKPADIVVRQAELWLGRDASPNDEATDELGCADSVTSILRTIYKDFPHTISTIELHNLLNASPYFRGTLTPSPGCIIVSPRIGAQPGHCGIFLTATDIASNSSYGENKGLWVQNYTLEIWVKYFKLQKGLHIYLYEPTQ